MIRLFFQKIRFPEMIASHPKRTILIVMYFAVWFVFGFIFKMIADNTNGEAFIFQENIQLKKQEQLFFNSTDNYDHRFIKNLIKEIDLDDKLGSMAYGNNCKSQNVLDRPLSETWIKYYCHKFNMLYFNRYKIELEYCGGHNAKYMCNITLYNSNGLKDTPKYLNRKVYRNAKYITGDNTEKHPLFINELSFPLVITTDRNSFIFVHNEIQLNNLFKSITGNSHEEITSKYDIIKFMLKQHYTITSNIRQMHMLKADLATCINYLDDDYSILETIINGKYKYDIADFLYFSAVTITTLGYGDILPNNTTVRKLVMLETFIGIILIGAFISSLFEKERGAAIESGKA